MGSLESTKEAEELPEAIPEGNASFLSALQASHVFYNSIAKSMNQLFYSIAGGIVHQIRSEKLQQYQKWLFVVSEILSKIGIGFISNFLLKARVLSSKKFTLTFEGWNRPVCHLFGFTRVSFCQKLLHFTLGQWSESWRRWCLTKNSGPREKVGKFSSFWNSEFDCATLLAMLKL